MIVVDTNIICYYWLDSSLSPKAEALREQDADWAVPPLWRSEFRNALLNSVRHQILAISDAIDVLERAEKLLQKGEIAVSSRVVMELAARSSCTAYDCEFVAVARDQGLRLVTTDKQVLREFPETAVSLGNFLAGRS